MFVFDIPAQSLEGALDAFADTSRTQVLYETALTSGRRSSAVSGQYTPDSALRLLLAGTDLVFGYTAERSITLSASGASSPNKYDARDEHQRQLQRFDHFLGGVQAGILFALCRDETTRPGQFNVAMRFQIASTGAILVPALLNSTGLAIRDAAITRALSRLSFSEPPPPGLPQPITVVLRPSARSDQVCADHRD